MHFTTNINLVICLLSQSNPFIPFNIYYSVLHLLKLAFLSLFSYCINLVSHSEIFTFVSSGETIRFRVTAECFEETSPVGPEKDSPVETEPLEPKVPYKLTVSIFLKYWN